MIRKFLIVFFLLLLSTGLAEFSGPVLSTVAPIAMPVIIAFLIYRWVRAWWQGLGDKGPERGADTAEGDDLAAQLEADERR